MGLAAGVVGAAGIGAVGSLGGSLLQSGAAQSASQQQQQAQELNLQFQTGLLGVNENNLNPFIQSGQQATGTLNKLLTPGAGQTAALEQLPGFQFQSKWGTKSTQNALAAEGLGGSTGPLSQAISNYNQGLASTDFSTFVSQLQAQQGQGISAAGAVTGATNSAGAQGGNALTSAGNAAAAGTLGSANALSNGITGAGSSASNALLLSQLLGGNSGGIFSNLGSSAGVPNSAFDFFG
jgi:hypothetical protein